MTVAEQLDSSPELAMVAIAAAPVTREIASADWGKYFVAYTDGSCRSMQGVEQGPGGWAAIIFSARGQRWEARGNLDNTTSNRAEVSALIAALLCTPDGAHISVQSDSRYVVDHVRRWMRAADNDDLWTEVREIVVGKQLDLRATWVAGHNGHQHNERADLLASGDAMRRRKRRG
ncbi:MAG: RNase H family protein [Chloroflexota bacterium]